MSRPPCVLSRIGKGGTVNARFSRPVPGSSEPVLRRQPTQTVSVSSSHQFTTNGYQIGEKFRKSPINHVVHSEICGKNSGSPKRKPTSSNNSKLYVLSSSAKYITPLFWCFRFSLTHFKAVFLCNTPLGFVHLPSCKTNNQLTWQARSTSLKALAVHQFRSLFLCRVKVVSCRGKTHH